MIKRLREQESAWRFVKFLVVGVFNTAFGVAVYELLVFFGMAPQPALALAYFIGIIWNYFTHGKIVFENQGFGKFPAYLGTYLLIYLVNAAGLQLLLNAGVSKYLAQPILAAIVAVPTFFLISYVLTGKWPFFGDKS